jgi:hypothetical protein
MSLKRGALMHQMLLQRLHMIQGSHMVVLVICQDEDDIRAVGSRIGQEKS